jgi:hypothetical protein
VRRSYNLLPLALIVSALLFLMACPHKFGGAADSGPGSQESGGEKPIVHHFGGGTWIHHRKHTRISLPKPPHASGSGRPVAGFFEDHPTAGSRRAVHW